MANRGSGTMDWREALRQNTRRTRYVMATFVLIYLSIGFLIDLFIQSEAYPAVPLSVLAQALFSLKIVPVASCIAGMLAAIALAVTYTFHNKIMLLGTSYIEITSASAESLLEKQLFNSVEEMKVAAGLAFMPKVFLIDADYMNAFASGYSERSAMVAITRGLLEKLTRDELTAVMAHELSHIRHMDIKLTLTASVLSNLTLIAIDLLFFGALFSGGSRIDRNNGGGRNALFMVIMILRYVLPLVTMLLTLYLSRTREYMADAGCVELMRTNEPLANALIKIHQDNDRHQVAYAQAYADTPHESVRRQAYIIDPQPAGLMGVSGGLVQLSTHPTLKDRLKALGFSPKRSDV